MPIMCIDVVRTLCSVKSSQYTVSFYWTTSEDVAFCKRWQDGQSKSNNTEWI